MTETLHELHEWNKRCSIHNEEMVLHCLSCEQDADGYYDEAYFERGNLWFFTVMTVLLAVVLLEPTLARMYLGSQPQEPPLRQAVEGSTDSGQNFTFTNNVIMREPMTFKGPNAPAQTQTGDMWFNTETRELFQWDGRWRNLSHPEAEKEK